MDWLTPDSTNDPDMGWTNDANAIDENTGTFTYTDLDGGGDQSGYFELIIAEKNCSKVRFNIDADESEMFSLELDAYWGGAWHSIFDGVPNMGEWVEKELGGTYAVTKARIRFTDDTEEEVGQTVRIYEFDFWGEAAAAVKPWWYYQRNKMRRAG